MLRRERGENGCQYVAAAPEERGVQSDQRSGDVQRTEPGVERGEVGIVAAAHYWRVDRRSRPAEQAVAATGRPEAHDCLVYGEKTIQLCTVAGFGARRARCGGCDRPSTGPGYGVRLSSGRRPQARSPLHTGGPKPPPSGTCYNPSRRDGETPQRVTAPLPAPILLLPVPKVLCSSRNLVKFYPTGGICPVTTNPRFAS